RQGARWASRSSLGEEVTRSFLAPARDFQIACFGCSLSEQELAGRAQG
ncbi:hypothetical protein A2U01_0096223, partial [Trifolium medium]|nr:hypothetical protein [Trifolium medium]